MERRYTRGLGMGGSVPSRGALLGAALGALAPGLLAQPAREPIQLRWQAPASCPSEQAVRAEVTRLLGGSPRGSRQIVARGVVELREGSVRVEVRTEADGEVGERTVEASTCAQAADAFAIIVALTFDPAAPLPPAPSASASAGAPASAASAPASAASAPVARPPAASEGEPGGWAAGAAARGGLGVVPGLGAGVRVFAAARRAWGRGELGVDVWLDRPSRVDEQPGKGGNVGLWTAAGALCRPLAGRRLGLDGCAGAEAGRMTAEGFGVRSPSAGASVWLALTASAVGRLALSRTLALRLGLEAALPLVRPIFFLRGVGDVYRPAPLGGRATLAAEANFLSTEEARRGHLGHQMASSMSSPRSSPAGVGALAPPEVCSSFDEVYARYAPFVWRSVQRLGVPSSSVEDAVQDIFVVVYRKLPEYEERSTMRAWLYAIVLRVVRDHRRGARRKPSAAHGPEPRDPDTLADARSPDPLAAAQQSEAVRRLYRLLEQLDDSRREVFVLSELEELTAPEIADALSVNINTVYWRLRTARQEFEAALSRDQAQERRRQP